MLSEPRAIGGSDILPFRPKAGLLFAQILTRTVVLCDHLPPPKGGAELSQPFRLEKSSIPSMKFETNLHTSIG
jgi:hypothetical protein